MNGATTQTGVIDVQATGNPTSATDTGAAIHTDGGLAVEKKAFIAGDVTLGAALTVISGC